ncbi:MAG TPA: beta-N-acetylglucosaminidase domain-containing protein [Candidatus Dormibacteraeota bacterium]|nr:beta-N-acetylglucosaminidase domain-containing protein [Candidatus Dormibacteraeota bacterium]
MAATDESFTHRGVIEGYYGPPYSHADRLWLLERMAAWGMNRYVYAPKDDPLHRAQWRTAYSGAMLREFGELIERGAALGVAVGFAVSPGLTIEYGSADDVRALQEKFRGFGSLGARFFCLALDDVPTGFLHAGDAARFPSLAAAHVALTHAVAEAVGDDAMLWLVPTDYVGTGATDYLALLGAELAPAIEVGWTGRTVVSPTITAAEAAARAATLRRRLLVWDNVPVTDGPMRPMLHLGPYQGRDAALPRHVSGLLLNPMAQPRASAVAVRTAADYMADPSGYDVERSWRAAVAEVGAGASAPFALFAAAHRFSPSAPDDRDGELEALFGAVRAAFAAGTGAPKAVAALRAALEPRVDAAETLRAELDDRALAEEIEPWLVSQRAESERMLAAVDLLEVFCADAPAMQRVFALFRLEGMLSRIVPVATASYGPRRVLYPQLVSMRDDEAAFGTDPALFVDRCLADEVVRFAEEVALRELAGSM